MQSVNARRVNRERIMHVTVNGNSHELDNNINLYQLLEQLKVGKGRVAIELNGKIVPKSQFCQHQLSNGDTIEIVQAIGGG